MSFRVLWFVVAGFVIGFTTSTLWEWLYYRRKRLALLEEHSHALRDAQRHVSAPVEEVTSAPREAPSWRPPLYRSPGVFLESEEAPTDSTFSGAAFTPPVTGQAPTASSVEEAAASSAAPGPAQGQRARALGDERSTLLPPRSQAVTNALRTARAASSLSHDDGAAKPWLPTDPSPLAPKAAPLAAAESERRTAVFTRTIGAEAEDEAPTLIEPRPATEPEQPTQPLRDTPTAQEEPRPEESDRADFRVVELTARTMPPVTPPVEPPLAADPGAGLAPPAEPAPERRTRERPDDYPDDLAMIKGIGEAYKRRLYATGIYTWRQVAESDIDSLRRITRAKPNADIQSWQTQGRELAEKYGRWEARFTGPLDDLTQIDGIGAITADMLYKAGICTYATLAQASPDELARIVPAPTVGNENDFEGWIRDAARLDQVKRKNSGLLP